jgi:hypothetical protein
MRTHCRDARIRTERHSASAPPASSVYGTGRAATRRRHPDAERSSASIAAIPRRALPPIARRDAFRPAATAKYASGHRTSKAIPGTPESRTAPPEPKSSVRIANRRPSSAARRPRTWMRARGLWSARALQVLLRPGWRPGATCSPAIFAAARASRTKRATASGLERPSDKRNLRATFVSSCTWWAATTTPIPPAPSTRSTRYLPASRSPGRTPVAMSRSETTGKVVDAATNLISAKLFARLGHEQSYLDVYLERERRAVLASSLYSERVRWFQFVSAAILKGGLTLFHRFL